ncbi:MAG TPA: hypothetical protein VKZ49_04850 [Polyangiaceae bacterium]|nr:hypothetical protein [Polyangiaceae bacterium]
MAEVAIDNGRAAAPDRSPPRWGVAPERLRAQGRKLGALLRPLPVVLAGCVLSISGRTADIAATSADPDLPRAIAGALGAMKLQVDPSEVHLIDPPAPVLDSRLHRPRAWVRARPEGEPADIFLVRSRLSPEGRLLELSGVYNITESSAVEEAQLVVHGERAAWVVGGGGKTYSVHYADARGEPKPEGPNWTRLARAQNALTNAQETGQLAGLRRRSFKLDPAASELTLGFTESHLLIYSDMNKIEVPTEAEGPILGERFLRVQQHVKARPGNLVTWAVDRVRALPWFGNDRMQAVKALAFVALDWAEQALGTVTGDDGSERVAEELGELLHAPPVTYTNPETGWPPPPMEPVLSPALKGEGQWVSLDRDAFIRQNPGTPSPFVFSFLRVDKKRIYQQVFVTVWDPRQVALHAMSGTREPKSATGETGPGLIPRDPKVMSRLVGALNGGFQAQHGHYGMMVDKVTYLPPKPYAATIAELKDGSNGFGTWPEDATIPAEMVSFRQNLVPLVLDGEFNPYRSQWWGGVPEGWTDDSRTVRSALCLTEEGFVAYFYAASVDPPQLSLAMRRARCQYGVHLDMNAGHTGLEFYRVDRQGALPPLGRALDPQWEASGAVSGMDGWEFRGRQMVKLMALMNFPRYIHRESRDFFYLTLRHLLPGVAVPSRVDPAEPGEGQWQVDGLPQHGWPYAIATTWVRPDAARAESKVNLVKLDPKMVRLTDNVSDEDAVVLAVRHPRGGSDDSPALWLSAGKFEISPKAPGMLAKRISSGLAFATASSGTARAAVGVGSHDGMLYYLEVATAPSPDRDGALLDRLLADLGCDERMLLDEPLGVAIGGKRDLGGHPVKRTRNALYFVRGEGPGARRIFTDTPIVPPHTWYALQKRRTHLPATAAATPAGG